jgi:ribosomal protein S18 acetylase RimI-like enzyme
MSASIDFRPVVPGDRDLLLRLYASTRQTEMNMVPWSAEQKNAFIEMQFKAQDMFFREKFADAEFSIILSNGTPAGRLYVVQKTDALHVIDLTVLPSHRELGVGAAVVRRLQDDARAKALPLTIYVDTMSPAIAFFAKRGFTKEREEALNVLMMWKPPATTVD